MSAIDGRSPAGAAGSRRDSPDFMPGKAGRTSPAVFAGSGLAAPGATGGRFTGPEGSDGLGVATSGILDRMSAARGRSADPTDGIGLCGPPGVAAAPTPGGNDGVAGRAAGAAGAAALRVATGGCVTLGNVAGGGEPTRGATEGVDGVGGAERGASTDRVGGLATAEG